MALSVISLLWVESVPATAVALFGLGLGGTSRSWPPPPSLRTARLPSERGPMMGFNDMLSG
jgi:hypothetical protein